MTKSTNQIQLAHAPSYGKQCYGNHSDLSRTLLAALEEDEFDLEFAQEDEESEQETPININIKNSHSTNSKICL